VVVVAVVMVIVMVMVVVVVVVVVHQLLVQAVVSRGKKRTYFVNYLQVTVVTSLRALHCHPTWV
jgi:hypothetical protein